VIQSFARFSRRAVSGLVLSVREPAAGWLVIRMLAWRAALPVMERVVPLPTLVRLMGCHRRVRDRNGQAQRIVELAERVFHVPSSGQNCLARSLVIYRFLSKTSVEPQLVIAFQKGAAPVLGHAWVTVNAIPIHDSPQALDEFEPLVVFSPAGGCRQPTRATTLPRDVVPRRI
jgi:hypothetical protein